MTGTMKLTQSVKVVQVPVAGQPGRYMTGFLPVVPQSGDTYNAPPQPTPLKNANCRLFVLLRAQRSEMLTICRGSIHL